MAFRSRIAPPGQIRGGYEDSACNKSLKKVRSRILNIIVLPVLPFSLPTGQLMKATHYIHGVFESICRMQGGFTLTILLVDWRNLGLISYGFVLIT